eukprot:CAMPEP_0119299582 /NCGR_PEP_ID=MMETSP1333-20130426/1653_1 /TAXON_ID=418940 /ORGANISM="Scyphosphaera apsteinii, Strain RCC1455" /LENGTH=149 /DNA_ID=CAMNT_0007301053 /DNA_START=188 /DNA_END=634 /DNA_ORIENTATION=+
MRAKDVVHQLWEDLTGTPNERPDRHLTGTPANVIVERWTAYEDLGLPCMTVCEAVTCVSQRAVNAYTRVKEKLKEMGTYEVSEEEFDELVDKAALAEEVADVESDPDIKRIFDCVEATNYERSVARVIRKLLCFPSDATVTHANGTTTR